MTTFRPSGIEVLIRQDLAAGSGRTGTTLLVDPIYTLDGHRVVMTDIGSICFGKIDPGIATLEEIISWTGMTNTDNDTTLTGVKWGYNFYNTTNSVADNQKIHVVGSTMVITNDDHFLSTQYNTGGGTGTGDVIGPASNTDGYIPQWYGADSKTLKDGIPTSTFEPAKSADDNYVTNAEKIVIGNTSGTNTGDEPDASTTVKGIVELAIASEVNTGTSTALAVTPDALAGSVMGTKGFCVIAVAPTTDVSATDGKAYIMIPPCMNGMNLVSANASVVTAGTTNATTIDIYNVTDSHDMLSTAISIASAGTVGTAGTVNASYDDVATNDILRIDVTSASTTNAKGLQVILEFQLA